MRRTLALVILYFLLAPGLAFAGVDSLKTVLQNTEISVKERVRVSRKLLSYYSQRQLDSALHYAQVHLGWTEASGDTVLIIDALHALASISEYRLEPDEADRYVKKASDLIDQIGDLPSKFHNHNLRAAIADDRFDSAEELHFQQQALMVANQLADSALITIALNNLANFHKAVGNFEKAHDCYVKALAICEALGNDLGAKMVILNQAQLDNDQKQFSQAVERVMPAMNYFKDNGHSNYLAFAYSSLAASYYGLEQYQQVLIYANWSEKILQETGSAYGLAEAYTLKGNALSALGKADSASFFLTQALKLVEANRSPEELRSCYKSLYEFHKKHGAPSQALHFHERYIGVRDSIEGIANRNKIENVRLDFKLKEAHYQDSLLFEQVRQAEQMEFQLAQSKRNTYFVFAIIAIVLISLTVLIYLRFKNIKEKLEKQSISNQLDNLKSAVMKDLVLTDEPKATPPADLHRERIENNLSAKLNDTDWDILLALYQTPMLTNKTLAQQVNKSFEGVRSSLKKMYRLFDLTETQGNRKAALIIKAIELSSVDMLATMPSGE